ncbi:uncharacterized protein At2g39795, mitochondrial [Malania oleifera]|uniref:uncharacterized protein At2g39795, mitochondrial n=1 Tax=Malania oleifera TaxID=397392 RepID=UPI0025AE4ED1|nr:uncharacterized protein At2g39795, mitochondrial [Malania oleifera]XP_057982056.1 uncharacterized protein At2g39795, mitochondrial [Malania oleifera]
MPRATPVLRQIRKAIADRDLLKVLTSEIKHELSSNRFQDSQSGSLGDFVLIWDAPKSLDVFLRRKYDTGEEVAVSAFLDPQTYSSDDMLPREALMKVCIKKPGLCSNLQFDCRVFSGGNCRFEFDIHNAYYLRSSTCLSPSVYRGPLFSSLDPQLQEALKEYLVDKGVGESLTNFLLHHLHRKEQAQYVHWLHELEKFVGEDV